MVDMALAPPRVWQVSKQRMLTTGFWSDPWVVDELNPLDRYLFIYLLTNEHTTIGGVYELSMRTMANETGIEKEELSRMLKRMETRVIYMDGWVVFRKAIMHQNIGSPKIKAAVAQTLKSLPRALLEYVQVPADFGELLQAEYGIDTVSIWYPDGMHTLSHSNTNLNSNSNSKGAKAPVLVDQAAQPKSRPRPAVKTSPAPAPASTSKTLTYRSLFTELVQDLGFDVSRILLTKERQSKLKVRLSSYSPDQLRTAAKNLGADSHMQGDNKEGKRWGTIDYLLRNDTTVAKYLENDAAPAGVANIGEIDESKYV
jgi:hypothetical protein